MSKSFKTFLNVFLIIIILFTIPGGISQGNFIALFIGLLCIGLMIFINLKYRENKEPVQEYNENGISYERPSGFRETEKVCPKCAMDIPIKAKVCPHCRNRIGGFSLGNVLIATTVVVIAVFGIITLALGNGGSGEVRVVGECSTEIDEFGVRYYTGTIKNETSTDYGYVDVTIGFYDENGVKLGSGIDNVLNLGAGETWKFSVVCIYDNAKTAKVEKIDCY